MHDCTCARLPGSRATSGVVLVDVRVGCADDPSTMRDGWTFVEAEKGGTGFVPTDYLVDAGGVPPPAVPSSLCASLAVCASAIDVQPDPSFL